VILLLVFSYELTMQLVYDGIFLLLIYAQIVLCDQHGYTVHSLLQWLFWLSLSDSVCLLLNCLSIYAVSFLVSWNVVIYISVERVIHSFVIVGRGPAYSGPQHWDLYVSPVRQPRERRGIGRCVRCTCTLCRVAEGLSRREQLVWYF